MEKYRVVRFYDPFSCKQGARLQKRVKFLFWRFWETIAQRSLNGDFIASQWAEQYNCKIIKESQ